MVPLEAADAVRHVLPLFVAIGFVPDLIDHAYGRDNSPISSAVAGPAENPTGSSPAAGSRSVHLRSRGEHSARPALIDPAGRGEGDGVPGRTGHGCGGGVDGEVVQAEPAGHGRGQWCGFEEQAVAALDQGGAGGPGAVGGVAVQVQARGLFVFLEQAERDGGLVVFGSGPGADGDRGVDPGLGLDGEVGFVSVLFGRAGLVHVSGFGVDGGDDPVRGGAAGDAPAPVAPVRVLGRLDVLAGHEGEQAERVGCFRAVLAFGQGGEQPDRVGDRRVDDLGTGCPVVPGDLRFAGVGVVVRGAHGRDRVRCAGHLARHAPDRGDDLGDGVPGGDRVVEHRGVQRPAHPAFEHAGLGHHGPDRGEDPLRVARAGQTPAEVGQQ